MSRTYSVVVPAHNSALTIEACLRSVAVQTRAPLEVIVVDDASTDSTREAVRACEPLLGAAGIRLTLLTLDPNAGPSAARNSGMRASSGTHIAFLDSDDVWRADKLDVVDGVASRDGVGLVCHRYTDGVLDPEDHAAHRSTVWPLARMLLRNPAQTSCAVVDRRYAEPFDESMRYCEDHDLWMRIAERATVLRLAGAPLTRLSRPQLSAGGLSANTIGMRLGEMRVYRNFCRRRWRRRFWLLPVLLAFSSAKHVYSWVRRHARIR